jgi:VWFA-related protein
MPQLATGQQDKKRPDQGEIKLTAELVQIDVLVNDKNNKPVAGLKREDFELYDNNKLQHIANFSREETKARQIGNETTEARSLPRAIDVSQLKRVIAFVVDTLHIKFENVARVRKVLADFVDNKMQPGDLVLILPTGGGSGVLQQFTSDQRLLHRSIDRLRPIEISNTITPYRSLNRYSSSPGGAPPPFARSSGSLSMPDRGNAGGRADPLEEADVRGTLGVLNETIKSMSKLPGRKVSVFLSEGFRLFSTQMTSDLVLTTAHAARANVVFYTIDARGLEPLGIDASDEIAGGRYIGSAVADASQAKRADFFESQNTLNAIASDTGGKFFRNNNDIQGGLNSMLEENSAYYMLGFYPEAGKWDGKYHKIKVMVRSRPDLVVSFRKGYLAKSPVPEKVGVDPKVAEALEAISSPLVRRDIDLRLTPLYIDNAQRDPVVTLLLHIDASKLRFVQSEGRYQSKLEQIGFVFDGAGRTVDSFSNTLDLNLQQQTYESALKRGFVATRTLNVKAGVYQIRLFVREADSGLIGTANDYIEIPDMKSERLSTSSLFLTGQTVQQGKVVETAGLGGTPSQRRFQQKGEFAYSMVIYNAKVDNSKQPQLETRTRVLKGNQVVFNGEFRSVPAGEGSTQPSRVTTGGVIKLIQLAPDDYTLQVLVRDKLRKKDNLVRTEMDFSVE